MREGQFQPLARAFATKQLGMERPRTRWERDIHDHVESLCALRPFSRDYIHGDGRVHFLNRPSQCHRSTVVNLHIVCSSLGLLVAMDRPRGRSQSVAMAPAKIFPLTLRIDLLP